MKRRTKPLETGIKVARRRARAVQAAATRRRCSGCGSFLSDGGQCRNPDCEGQKARQGA